MKTLLCILMLSSIAAPALAFDLTISAAQTAVSLTSDEVGRRSGNCPNRPEEPLRGTESVSRWDYRSCGGN